MERHDDVWEVDVGPQFQAFLTSVIHEGGKFHTPVPVLPIHTSQEGYVGPRSQSRHYRQEKPCRLSNLHPSIVNTISHPLSGFGSLEVAYWPLVPKFAGAHPGEAVGFLWRKNPQHVFLRRGRKAVGPMS